MAAMTTALAGFSNYGNSRTSTYTGHTTQEPRLVIEKRRVPEGNQTVAEYSMKVLSSTEDSDGTILAQKVSLEAIVRMPVTGIVADVEAALVIFRDIIAGDEFANSIATQEWLT